MTAQTDSHLILNGEQNVIGRLRLISMLQAGSMIPIKKNIKGPLFRELKVAQTI